MPLFYEFAVSKLIVSLTGSSFVGVTTPFFFYFSAPCLALFTSSEDFCFSRFAFYSLTLECFVLDGVVPSPGVVFLCTEFRTDVVRSEDLTVPSCSY